MDFKWIEFLIEWILNGLDHRKNGLDHKNWIFCPPLTKIMIKLNKFNKYMNQIEY